MKRWWLDSTNCKPTRIMKFDPDQLFAIGKVNEGHSVFITGPAGTGKSSVTVEIIRRRLGARSLKVCATTGVAALNLRDKLSSMFGEDVNTSTIYRWAGIGIGPKEHQSFEEYFRQMQAQGLHWQATAGRIRGTQILIIDEVSMLPGKILNFVDYVCRQVRGDDRPMGGIQVIAVGDFLQLPPVSKTGLYDWAFASEAWRSIDFKHVTLRQVHRQDDPDFVSVLNQFREGTVTKDGAAILKKRVAMFPPANVLRLFTHNVQVDKWNTYQLGTLETLEHVFAAKTSGPKYDVEFLVKNLITPERLVLKLGARAMVTANLRDPCDSEGMLAANGEIGTVVDVQENCVSLRLDTEKVIEIERNTWKFDSSQKNTAEFKQFPLRLAWAATIHKSQGLTLDSALIDIRAAREPGQAYVAVSRVKSLQGLLLKDWFAGLFVSPAAKNFHRAIA
jgi:ATP-dependent DNA helicase PIF1